MVGIEYEIHPIPQKNGSNETNTCVWEGEDLKTFSGLNYDNCIPTDKLKILFEIIY